MIEYECFVFEYEARITTKYYRKKKIDGATVELLPFLFESYQILNCSVFVVIPSSELDILIIFINKMVIRHGNGTLNKFKTYAHCILSFKMCYYLYLVLSEHIFDSINLNCQTVFGNNKNNKNMMIVCDEFLSLYCLIPKNLPLAFTKTVFASPVCLSR